VKRREDDTKREREEGKGVEKWGKDKLELDRHRIM
jgi:hypothetical protein